MITTSLATALVCRTLCLTSTQTWRRKCNWVNMCTGCSQCQGEVYSIISSHQPLLTQEPLNHVQLHTRARTHTHAPITPFPGMSRTQIRLFPLAKRLREQKKEVNTHCSFNTVNTLAHHPPATLAACSNWCSERKGNDWTVKCTWSTCAGCSECSAGESMHAVNCNFVKQTVLRVESVLYQHLEIAASISVSQTQ